MVEPIMYFAIGFLISTLVGLGILPLVHNRAVRLTTKRLEAATPVSMAEIQADKDHLRAEFAMSARRLEMNVEQLKAKTTTQLAELGKKSDIINRMKYELGEKNAAIFQLEARERSVKDSLKSTETEFAAKTQLLREAETQLSEKQAELGRIGHELSDRSQLADTRQLELTSVNAQIAALQERVNEAEREFTDTQNKLSRQQTESTQATRDLDEARSRITGLSQRVSELEHQLTGQTKDAEALAARANDLEGRLEIQTKMLTERGIENHQLRQQIEVLQKQAPSSLTAGEVSKTPDFSALEKLRAEKAAIEGQLAAALDERGRLQREVNAVRQQSESSWASERMENAVLRERINDVAAEVAKLAMTLEGPDSPIEALLALDPSDHSDDHKVTALNPANGNQPVPASAPQALTGKGTLADRIRALQSQSSRAQQA
jgi:chromosome segregation ATPase